jgi:plasmid stabilization system protein ParE
VLISADAEAQLATIRAWWLSNRPSAPELFDRELDVAIATLRHAAHSFPAYRAEADSEIRRVLLPRSRYALYYSIAPDDDVVLIVAVWHTARGSGPSLP